MGISFFFLFLACTVLESYHFGQRDVYLCYHLFGAKEEQDDKKMHETQGKGDNPVASEGL